MNKSIPAFGIALLLGFSANAQVWISEVLPNAPGADTGNEHFELHGTPGLSLSNYYLISLEGQGGAKGDVNQFFDLGAFSLGANGYLFARQAGSRFDPVQPGAALVENTIGTGWGQVNGIGSTTGHSSDAAQADVENSATTILLVSIGTGQPPTIALDMDIENDGLLDVPEGWTVVDSVGIMDGANALSTDASYGVITFRAPDTNNNYVGTCAYGNIIDVPGPLTTTAGTFYVGRKGNTTGSTANDWMGSILQGAAGSPLAFYFYSPSDPAYSGRLVSDMVFGGTNAAPDAAGADNYTVTFLGTRFTNYTELLIGGSVGDVAVDPRDNSTIVFTMDSVLGSIHRATKVASGNWVVDPVPVVSGLDRPSGLVVQTNGTLWWVNDVAMALTRLKEPWSSNTPEMVITNFGPAVADDDPIDLTFAPANFTGSLGQPNWLVIADRGSDDDTLNALNLLDPATTELNQINNNFLVSPNASGLGWGNLNAMDSLAQSGEVITLSQDGFITAIDGNGAMRTIIPTTFWPLGSTPAGANLAVDPATGRVWLADDTSDEVWSVDPRSAGQTSDIKELSFPLVDPLKTYLQIDFHDPGMAFAPNGGFMVVSDGSAGGGGGRLLIFHNEAISIPTFAITSVAKTAAGVQLHWASAGSVNYSIRRGTNVADPASFQTIATNLTVTSFTDTNTPAQAAFYRVIAQP